MATYFATVSSISGDINEACAADGQASAQTTASRPTTTAREVRRARVAGSRARGFDVIKTIL